ncbi:hypothetical protein ACFW9L_38160, partial [Streptomyces sp. NPDC059517]|uniref:hypothetical protein n=1 Tax=Streptomyces sp. NPDC059517 TaxID=3346855 RepID=UPI0036BCE1DA
MFALEVLMNGLFGDLDRLDLDGHVRRWSAPEAAQTAGEVNQWLLAAQMFATRLQRDPVGMSVERWRAVGAAWAALLAAAERSTGALDNEWLFRDLWLRAWLAANVGPREDVPLLDPGFVIERALDAMPMSPAEAAGGGARVGGVVSSPFRAVPLVARGRNPLAP